MVDRYAPLNDRQLAVLRWISDGCPDGVMVGFTYKTTALALQSRRLVAVSKRRGGWRAELTDAGRYYLERGRHPQRPPPRPAGWRRRPGVPSAAAALAATKQTGNVAHDGRRAEPRRKTAAGPPMPADTTSSRSDGRRAPVRYRVMVSRVQVAERSIRAVDEQDAARKVQEELDRPYSFIGGWRTVDTDLDVVESESREQHRSGRIRARARFRDHDGITRQVETWGRSGAAAERALLAKLRDRAAPTHGEVTLKLVSTGSPSGGSPRRPTRCGHRPSTSTGPTSAARSCPCSARCDYAKLP